MEFPDSFFLLIYEDMKLYRIIVDTYYFGNTIRIFHVLAESEEEAKRMLYEFPRFKNDDDAEIRDIQEIDLCKAGVIESIPY